MLRDAYETWGNNKFVKTPDQAQLQGALEKGIVWPDKNRDKILAISNPALWNMVRQAAEITNDQRLRSLFAAYGLHYLKDHRNIYEPLVN